MRQKIKKVKNCSHSTLFTVILIWNMLFTLDVCTFKVEPVIAAIATNPKSTVIWIDDATNSSVFTLIRLEIVILVRLRIVTITVSCQILKNLFQWKCLINTLCLISPTYLLSHITYIPSVSYHLHTLCLISPTYPLSHITYMYMYIPSVSYHLHVHVHTLCLISPTCTCTYPLSHITYMYMYIPSVSYHLHVHVHTLCLISPTCTCTYPLSHITYMYMYSTCSPFKSCPNSNVADEATFTFSLCQYVYHHKLATLHLSCFVS